MEKENLTTHNPFLVQPEQLRRREERKTFCFNRNNPKCKHKQNNQTDKYTQITSVGSSLNTSIIQGHRNVNWLRYNILVGIYQNWLRLYPYIQHFFWRFPQVSKSISQQMAKFEYLKRNKAAMLQQNNRSNDLKNLIKSIKYRRLQILQKVSQIQDNGVDGQIIKFVNHMAQQLLSTLSIENTKWNKARIQKHNRLIDQAINKFSEAQFAVNSSAILESLKERLQFITKIQDSYIDSVKFDPNYKEKLISLKQPFEKGSQAEKRYQNIEEKLQLAWNKLKDERFKKKNIGQIRKQNSKANQRNQRYTVLSKTDNNSLIIKYKHKKNEYFNEAYIRSKMKQSKSKKKQGNQKQNAQNENDTRNDTNQLLKSSVFIKEVDNSSRNSSSIDDNGFGKELQKEELDIIDSFIRKTRQKVHKENQGSMFNRPKPNKKQSLARPSISYFQPGKLQKQNANRKSFSLQNAGQKRNIVSGRGSKSSKPRPSIQNLFDETREDHLSRFKSHKKIVTTKHLKGVNSKVRLTKEKKNNFKYRDSNSRFQDSQSKIQKQEIKRQFFISNRKGNLLRKGVFRKAIQREMNLDQILVFEPGDFNYKRNQILTYFTMIKQKGLLNDEKYAHLKERVSQLVSKHSPFAKAANREYAQKIYEKSIKSDTYEFPEDSFSNSELRRDNFLKQLSGIIQKDERVQMKIKEEMKIYYDQNVEVCMSQGESGNEHYVFNSVQLVNLQDQLKRLLQFQQQNKTISFANTLKNRYNKLEQKQLE